MTTKCPQCGVEMTSGCCIFCHYPPQGSSALEPRGDVEVRRLRLANATLRQGLQDILDYGSTWRFDHLLSHVQSVLGQADDAMKLPLR